MSDPDRSRVRIESLAQVFAVLAEAAELEHGVMCGYLYSAFGLRANLPTACRRIRPLR